MHDLVLQKLMVLSIMIGILTCELNDCKCLCYVGNATVPVVMALGPRLQTAASRMFLGQLNSCSWSPSIDQS